MFNSQKPNPSDLPTTGKLLCSTLFGAVVATGLLVTTVLPAEYAIDPTGAGRLLGLTEMGRVKLTLAREAQAETAAEAPPALAAVSPEPQIVQTAAAPQAQAQTQTQEMTITLAPDAGAEIKLKMRKGASVRYTWQTSGPAVNFDTHADAPSIKYHPYGKGSEAKTEGVLTAAFDGSHGWFWRNRSGRAVTVTLRVTGEYLAMKRVV